MNILETALHYAGRGWPVVPLDGKKPWLQNWTKKASTDPATIRSWWAERPGSNVGLATGTAFWVLDIDPAHGGLEELAQLEEEHGELVTLRAQTGSGGLHLFFSMPDGIELGNRIGVRPGIDVRAVGGQVVAAPSIHPDTGKPYHWSSRRPPAEAPAWLVELVKPPVAAQRQAYVPPALVDIPDRERRFVHEGLVGACRDIVDAGEGARHKVLHGKAVKLGGYVAAGLIDEELVRAELQRAGEASGKDAREVSRAIRDGLQSGMQRPIRPTLREETQAEAPRASREQVLAYIAGTPQASYREVSEACGVPIGTVKRYVHESRPATEPLHVAEPVRPGSPRFGGEPPPGSPEPGTEPPPVRPEPPPVRPEKGNGSVAYQGEPPPVRPEPPPGSPPVRPEPPTGSVDPITRVRRVADALKVATDKAQKMERIFELLEDAAWLDAMAELRNATPEAGVADLLRMGEAFAGAKTVIAQVEAALKSRAKVLKQAPPPGGSSGGGGGPREEGERPEIRITTNVTGVLNQALVALKSQPRLFQRGGQLVHLTRDGAPQGMAFEADTPSLRSVRFGRMFELLSGSARWVKSKQTPSGYVDEAALPPKWAVDGVLSREEWPVRRAMGISEIPVLRPDGSIHDTAGYDDATGYIYEAPARMRIPWPRGELTRELAVVALDALYEPLQDFPFADEWHRAAAVACLLTLVGRPAIDGPVPLFTFTATTPKSGKSLLADVLYAIATGRDTPRMSPGSDDVEMQKQITAVAKLGLQAVLFDNIEEPLGGPSLDAAITGRIWQGRVLGASDFYVGPLRTVFMATANGLAIKGDMAQRVMPCHLEPEEERPELRSGFAISRLRPWIRENRPKLVSAALTLLRCHAAAGRPMDGVSNLGAFEEWNEVVRGALVWAGAADPYKGVATLVETADERRGQLRALLATWYEAFVAESVFVSDLPARIDKHPALLEVLKLVASNRDGSVNYGRLGYLFRQAAGRNYGGLQLVRSDSLRHGVRAWRVSRVVTQNSADVVSAEDIEVPS